MMKRFASLFVQDMKVSFRNALILFLVIVMLLMIALLRFVVPKSQAAPEPLFLVDLTEGRVLEAMLEGEETVSWRLLPDRQALQDALENESQTLGIIVSGTIMTPDIEVLHRGLLNERTATLMKQQLAREFSGTVPVTVNVSTLREAGVRPDNRMAMIPVLLALDVLMLGFMMGAVLMLEERDEGTLKALRIAPVHVSGYILSKGLVFLLVGLMYTGLLLVVMGTYPVNPFPFWLIVIMGSLFFTFVGMALATFFKNMSEWMFVGFGALILSMLPVLSFLIPSFNPVWMSWIPTAWMIRAFNELLFPAGRSITLWVWLITGTAMASYGLCHLFVGSRLMKEGAR